MTSMLSVMQPGRSVEMMPHFFCSALQQPISGVPMASTLGQEVSGSACNTHSVVKPVAVLFEAQRSLPSTVTQHGTTHGFIAKSLGAVQVSPPHVTGAVDGVSVQVSMVPVIPAAAA
jgi:hypothetical protein